MGFWDFWHGSSPQSPASQPATGPANVTISQQPRLLDDTPAQSPPPTSISKIESSNPPKNRSALLFGAGVTFFAFSILISRRSLARRRLAASAASFTPSAHAATPPHVPPASPAFDAFEALNIATINVLSLAMMGAGGTCWYLNINSMEDARRIIRGGLGVDGTGRSEQDAEEDFEEWMATVLNRKEAKQAKTQMDGEVNQGRKRVN